MEFLDGSKKGGDSASPEFLGDDSFQHHPQIQNLILCSQICGCENASISKIIRDHLILGVLREFRWLRLPAWNAWRRRRVWQVWRVWHWRVDCRHRAARGGWEHAKPEISACQPFIIKFYVKISKNRFFFENFIWEVGAYFGFRSTVRFGRVRHGFHGRGDRYRQLEVGAGTWGGGEDEGYTIYWLLLIRVILLNLVWF